MTSICPTLILLLLDQQLAAWLVMPGSAPREQRIEGEPGWMPCRTGDMLVQGLGDLLNRLGHELGTGPALEILCDDASRPLLTAALPRLAPLLADCVWQMQRWEPLAARCGRPRGEEKHPARAWIAEQVLPLLLARDDAHARQQMQATTQREHASLTEQLQAERAQLQRENDTLRAQNDAVCQIDAERLVVFLPALFARVFSEVGGQDLALLTGRPEPYSLPNPYPEPSLETLHELQRRFRALPRELQRQVVGFMARLPQRQRLKPRPEMRELILQLESE